jgi:hypothetical protein
MHGMTIALPKQLVDSLAELARQRGVDVQSLVDEVLRQFVAAAASITDVGPDDVARTQESMLGELNLPDWDGGEAA